MERHAILKDKNGKSLVTYTESDGILPMDANERYEIAPEMKRKENLTRKNNIFTENIGPGSNGFAGVALLATIISIAGIVIFYITLRY